MRLIRYAVLSVALISLSAVVYSAAPSVDDTVDDPLDAFEMRGLDGGMYRLTDWKGKVIVLNFWASWCSSCQIEIREFIQLQTQYGPQGLQVIGLGMDQERKLRNVSRTLGINYPVMVADEDRVRPLLQMWGNERGVVPFTIVIDRAGSVQAIHSGPIYRDELEGLFKPLLASTADHQTNDSTGL